MAPGRISTKRMASGGSEITPPATRQPSPLRMTVPSHAQATYRTWEKVGSLRNGEQIKVDGESLDIASLVSVAKYGSTPILDKSGKIISRIEESCATLQSHLDRDNHIYGVNTGFGGSADTRTKNLPDLQRGLVQHQNIGVLTRSDIGLPPSPYPGSTDAYGEFGGHSMPTSWVKGSMLTRLNSVIRGHSAVTLPVAEGIMALIQHDLTPVIPLRSSISASGDLSPLSYIVGALEGSPDIYVRTGKAHNFRIVTGKEALEIAGIEPIVLAAKEGLGLLNGTAVSAAAASLALHEANQLAVLSQVLTAMGCEALLGTAESFHPFIAAVRPHKGQIEAAANILGFLSGSRLAGGVLTAKDGQIEGLAQDRYALRTSSQWVAPQLEDLELAGEQLAVELNSTTDNPLIDVAGDTIHHGGNFQAASVTSAMEKTRLALQMLGKMLFSQATEMVNRSMNKGLPANLAADDPSLSFPFKGIDISMAAYMSELAFLANPVGSHVQSAEMHNQAINSLALISARYTMTAVEVLSLLSSAYLYTVCQALDLRTLQFKFFENVEPMVESLTTKAFKDVTTDESILKPLTSAIWKSLPNAWDETTIQDLPERASMTAESVVSVLFQAPEFEQMSKAAPSAHGLYTSMMDLQSTLTTFLHDTYDSTRRYIFDNHKAITPRYLGQASKKVYNFVRNDLNVPLHRGLVEHPTEPLKGRAASYPADQRKTLGSQISVIYEAMRDGRLYAPVMDAVKTNAMRP